jgi:hypothetical protein
MTCCLGLASIRVWLHMKLGELCTSMRNSETLICKHGSTSGMHNIRSVGQMGPAEAFNLAHEVQNFVYLANVSFIEDVINHLRLDLEWAKKNWPAIGIELCTPGLLGCWTLTGITLCYENWKWVLKTCLLLITPAYNHFRPYLESKFETPVSMWGCIYLKLAEVILSMQKNREERKCQLTSIDN